MLFLLELKNTALSKVLSLLNGISFTDEETWFRNVDLFPDTSREVQNGDASCVWFPRPGLLCSVHPAPPPGELCASLEVECEPRLSDCSSLLPDATYANVSKAERTGLSVCADSWRGGGARAWVWVLVLLHLAQIWLVRAWSWFPGGVTRPQTKTQTAVLLMTCAGFVTCSSLHTDVMEGPLCCGSYAAGSVMSAWLITKHS